MPPPLPDPRKPLSLTSDLSSSAAEERDGEESKLVVYHGGKPGTLASVGLTGVSLSSSSSSTASSSEFRPRLGIRTGIPTELTHAAEASIVHPYLPPGVVSDIGPQTRERVEQLRRQREGQTQEGWLGAAQVPAQNIERGPDPSSPVWRGMRLPRSNSPPDLARPTSLEPISPGLLPLQHHRVGTPAPSSPTFDPNLLGRFHFLVTPAFASSDLESAYATAIEHERRKARIQVDKLAAQESQLRQSRDRYARAFSPDEAWRRPEIVALDRQLDNLRQQQTRAMSQEALEEGARNYLQNHFQDYFRFLGKVRGSGVLFVQGPNGPEQAPREMETRIRRDWRLAREYGLSDRVHVKIPVGRGHIAQDVLGYTPGMNPETAGPFMPGQMQPSELVHIGMGGWLTHGQRAEVDLAAQARKVSKQPAYLSQAVARYQQQMGQILGSPGTFRAPYTSQQQLELVEIRLGKYQRDLEAARSARNSAWKQLTQISETYRSRGLPPEFARSFEHKPELAREVAAHPQGALIREMHMEFSLAEKKLREAYEREDKLTELVDALTSRRDRTKAVLEYKGGKAQAANVLERIAGDPQNMRLGDPFQMTAGRFKGFSMADVPMEELLWMTSGGERGPLLHGKTNRIEKETGKKFRTVRDDYGEKATVTDSVKFLRPVSFHREARWKEIGNLYQDITTYLRTAEGLGRLRSYFETQGLEPDETGPGTWKLHGEETLKERSLRTHTVLHEQERLRWKLDHARRMGDTAMVSQLEKELGEFKAGIRGSLTSQGGRPSATTDAPDGLRMLSKEGRAIVTALQKGEVDKALELLEKHREPGSLVLTHGRHKDQPGRSWYRESKLYASQQRVWRERYSQLIEEGIDPDEARRMIDRFKKEVESVEQVKSGEQVTGFKRIAPAKFYSAASFSEDTGEEDKKTKRQRERELRLEARESTQDFHRLLFANANRIKGDQGLLYFMLDQDKGGPLVNKRRKQIAGYLQDVIAGRPTVIPNINPELDFSPTELKQARARLNSRRLIYDPLAQASPDWKNLKVREPETTSSSATAGGMQAENLPEPKATLSMKYAYQDRGRPGLQSATTFEAIHKGERTQTTRWDEASIQGLQGLKAGDVVRFTGPEPGQSLLARVSADPFQTTPVQTKGMQEDPRYAQRWSQREGWSAERGQELFKEKGAGWILQYEYIQGSLSSPSSPAAKTDTESDVPGYGRKGPPNWNRALELVERIENARNKEELLDIKQQMLWTFHQEVGGYRQGAVPLPGPPMSGGRATAGPGEFTAGEEEPSSQRGPRYFDPHHEHPLLQWGWNRWHDAYDKFEAMESKGISGEQLFDNPWEAEKARVRARGFAELQRPKGPDYQELTYEERVEAAARERELPLGEQQSREGVMPYPEEEWEYLQRLRGDPKEELARRRKQEDEPVPYEPEPEVSPRRSREEEREAMMQELAELGRSMPVREPERPQAKEVPEDYVPPTVAQMRERLRRRGGGGEGE